LIGLAGTAIATGDDTAQANTLSFAAGITSQSITIDISDDDTVETGENFSLNLSNVQLVRGTAPIVVARMPRPP